MLDKDQLARLDNKALRRLIPVLFPVWEGGGYDKKVLATNPLAYWPLNDLSGTTARCLVNPAQNGTYTGATLANAAGPDGKAVPLFDGANDFVNIYSATLRDAFNAAEGSAMIWLKVFNVGVWTDGVARSSLHLQADNQDQTYMHRPGGNNTLRYVYEAGDVIELQDAAGQTSIGWINTLMTWSVADDEVIYYLQGATTGATDTALGTWVGNLAASKTLIGASVTTPSLVWYGWLAKAAVWTRALPQAQVTRLAVA